jgi:hypothetical protein
MDESTSGMLSQLSSLKYFRFGEPDTFGHSINFLDPARSSLSKFGKFCNKSMN